MLVPDTLEKNGLEALGMDPYPDLVHVIRIGARWAMWFLASQDIHGLATFTSKGQAERFTEMLREKVDEIVEMEFDCAREIVRNRPKVQAVFVMGENWDDPMIHFVR